MNDLEGVKFEEAEPVKAFNNMTGRMVIDDEQHDNWRQEYYKRIERQRGEQWMQQTGQLYRERMKELNIYSVTDVAEYFKVSRATAYNYMRQGIIPSFQKGRIWFTHAYVLENIDEKARKLFAEDYAKKAFPRMVWRFDKGLGWR